MPKKLSKLETQAFNAGASAESRIGNKAMCYDPIMQNLLIDARSESGRRKNRLAMVAWLRGRGWEDLISTI